MTVVNDSVPAKADSTRSRGLVSVIMPVYNRAVYVGAAIDSVLAQTWPAIEIILVNDGSTDDSLTILGDYAQRHPAQVRVIDQANQGQVAARNTAIEHATGEFIAFLDSDDLWEPTKLERQIPLFTSGVGLVYSAVQNIDGSGQALDVEYCDSAIRGRIYADMLVRNRMTGGTVVLSMSALEQVTEKGRRAFDESLSAAENWDLWIRISRHFIVDFVDEPLLRYRKHDDNMSNDNVLMFGAIEDILAKHAPNEAASAEVLKAHLEGQAMLAYRRGVRDFSLADYASARNHFKHTLSLSPGFKDARIRLMRCYLGRPGNRLLAALRAMLKR